MGLFRGDVNVTKETKRRRQRRTPFSNLYLHMKVKYDNPQIHLSDFSQESTKERKKEKVIIHPFMSTLYFHPHITALILPDHHHNAIVPPQTTNRDAPGAYLAMHMLAESYSCHQNAESCRRFPRRSVS
jgi:hypothetical protein